MVRINVDHLNVNFVLSTQDVVQIIGIYQPSVSLMQYVTPVLYIVKVQDYIFIEDCLVCRAPENSVAVSELRRILLVK